MLEALGALSGLYFIILIISLPFASLLIWIGIKIAGIKNSTFGKVVSSAVAASAITHIVTLIFYAFPHSSTIIGFFIGLFLPLFLIKRVFHSSLGKAFLVWIFNTIAQISAVIVGAVLFVGGIAEFIKII